jgi:hypothetical protein
MDFIIGHSRHAGMQSVGRLDDPRIIGSKIVASMFLLKGGELVKESHVVAGAKCFGFFISVILNDGVNPGGIAQTEVLIGGINPMQPMPTIMSRPCDWR